MLKLSTSFACLEELNKYKIILRSKAGFYATRPETTGGAGGAAGTSGRLLWLSRKAGPERLAALRSFCSVRYSLLSYLMLGQVTDSYLHPEIHRIDIFGKYIVSYQQEYMYVQLPNWPKGRGHKSHISRRQDSSSLASAFM